MDHLQEDAMKNVCRHYAALLRHFGFAQLRVLIGGYENRIGFAQNVGAAILALRALATDLWDVWQEGGKVVHLDGWTLFISEEEARRGFNFFICRHLSVPVEQPVDGDDEGWSPVGPLMLHSRPASRDDAEKLARLAFAKTSLADITAECNAVFRDPDKFAEAFA
jgi:hypothetical protein